MLHIKDWANKNWAYICQFCPKFFKISFSWLNSPTHFHSVNTKHCIILIIDMYLHKYAKTLLSENFQATLVSLVTFLLGSRCEDWNLLV